MKELEEIKEWYIREFGQRKYLKIESKVKGSKKIQKLLYLCQSVAPNKNDFYQCVMEMPYFMIAKADTILIGEIIAFEIWHNTVNKDFNYLDKYEFIKAFTGEHTRQDLQNILGLANRENFRKNHLQPALNSNLIELTIPDKPKSSKQKYRLTEEGILMRNK
jgi:hypothetical protein